MIGRIGLNKTKLVFLLFTMSGLVTEAKKGAYSGLLPED